jgi:D-arabinose 1-dehydrogenase-like Zn-dependent alcohol dehydrogenase
MSSAYPLIVACRPDAAPGYGAPFRITSLARPVPDSDQVLVRIMASGVNPLDIKIHAGEAAHARHPLPAILGIDLAGVEAVGHGVHRFRRQNPRLSNRCVQYRSIIDSCPSKTTSPCTLEASALILFMIRSGERLSTHLSRPSAISAIL